MATPAPKLNIGKPQKVEPMATAGAKEWQVTHPETGETRTVTARDWRAGKLAELGFTKPKDLDETA